jgi:cell volume regulation protein A
MTNHYLLLLLGGALVAFGLVAGLYSSRLGFSHLLVFLVVGMLAGVDGPLGLPFDHYGIAFAVGNLALALILLDGGLRTPMRALRRAARPAGLLATVGVVITAAVCAAAAAWLFDMDWKAALLLGAVLASTDAAAVFHQLGSSGVRLPSRLAETIEVESGLNDPMAVCLTLGLILLIQSPQLPAAALLALLGKQLAFGLAIGVIAAWLVAAALQRLPLLDDEHDGLAALLLAAAGTVAFALAGLVDGSGFLAVYLFGVIVAQRAPAVVRSALAALNGYTWLAQSVMFLLLGLLVTPSEVTRLALPALAVAAVLMLVARPLAVVACLAPLGFGWREQAFVSWVGLRGAVPIVLAVYPVIAGLPRSYLFFDVAFVAVLASLLLQGPSVGLLARRLGLDREAA